MGFFLYGFYNKDFSKDSGLVEIESNILPQALRTETRRHKDGAGSCLKARM